MIKSAVVVTCDVRSFRLSEDVGSGTTILFETEYYKMDSPQY